MRRLLLRRLLLHELGGRYTEALATTKQPRPGHHTRAESGTRYFKLPSGLYYAVG